MSRYPTDGIEINFDDYSPFIARREVAEHTETMTGWLREIRQACDLASKEQGRAKRLVIRIAGSLEGNRSLGMDLESWIREELVDSVIAMPVTHGYEAGAPELRKVVEATKGTRVKVLAGINNASNPQDTREVFAAAVANAYAAGAEGVLFHTYYPDPDRYPYDDSAMESMRFMGYPGRAGPQGQALPYRQQSQAGHSLPNTGSPGSSPWSWSPERRERRSTWRWPTTWRPRQARASCGAASCRSWCSI